MPSKRFRLLGGGLDWVRWRARRADFLPTNPDSQIILACSGSARGYTVKDCLFRLSKTELEVEAKDGALVVSNRGKIPAVAVNVNRPGHAYSFSASDNFFWLDPGESHTVKVNDTSATTAEAWNAERCRP